jgi:hypothetical protein
MKTLLLAGALALGLITNADARSHISHSHVTHSRSYDESGLVTHNHYTNVSGHDVHSPSKTLNGRAPSGAIRAPAPTTAGSRRSCSRKGGPYSPYRLPSPSSARSTRTAPAFRAPRRTPP